MRYTVHYCFSQCLWQTKFKVHYVACLYQAQNILKFGNNACRITYVCFIKCSKQMYISDIAFISIECCLCFQQDVVAIVCGRHINPILSRKSLRKINCHYMAFWAPLEGEMKEYRTLPTWIWVYTDGPGVIACKDQEREEEEGYNTIQELLSNPISLLGGQLCAGYVCLCNPKTKILNTGCNREFYII